MCRRNAAQVFGAASVSSLASKVNGPAVILSLLIVIDWPYWENRNGGLRTLHTLIQGDAGARQRRTLRSATSALTTPGGHYNNFCRREESGAPAPRESPPGALRQHAR